MLDDGVIDRDQFEHMRDRMISSA
ncbi:hypothetical protein [Aminobacter sp. BA135]